MFWRGNRLRTSLLVVLLAVAMVACFTPSKEQASTLPPAASQPSTSTPTLTPSQQPTSPPPSTPKPKPEPATITGDLIVRFLDVGQGDSIFILLPDGSSMLIDTGTKGVGGSVVAIIRGLGVKKIDHLILTHPHEDHIGGATAVLKAFDIGQVWMPRTSHTTQTYEDLLLSIEAKGLGIDEAKAGKVLMDKESLKAWFLNPSRAYYNLNNCSAVLALKYGDKTFLFEGDAEKEAEEAMTLGSSVKLPDVDVLKVAHHGSSSSSTKAFLNMVSPEIAVISVGTGNSYGHPAQTTLDRLAAQGTEVYRTDRHGTVTITTDGATLQIKTEKAPAATEAATPAAPTTPEPSSDDVTVYITKTGSKYHRDGCRYLSRSKIPITLKGAKARGFTPCSVCKPPR